MSLQVYQRIDKKDTIHNGIPPTSYFTRQQEPQGITSHFRYIIENQSSTNTKQQYIECNQTVRTFSSWIKVSL